MLGEQPSCTTIELKQRDAIGLTFDVTFNPANADNSFAGCHLLDPMQRRARVNHDLTLLQFQFGGVADAVNLQTSPFKALGIGKADREGEITSSAAHVGIVHMAFIASTFACLTDLKTMKFSWQAEAFNGWMTPHCCLNDGLYFDAFMGCLFNLLVDFSCACLCTSSGSTIDPFSLIEQADDGFALLS